MSLSKEVPEVSEVSPQANGHDLQTEGKEQNVLRIDVNTILLD